MQSPFGLVNAANTAPLPWGDRLFMTWDVGRPVEVDPHSLEFLGEVGRADEWQVFDLMPGPVLPMITSTAHPVIDPDRDCLWTVNTYFGQLSIVRWDGDGPIQRWPIAGAVDAAVRPHDHPDPRLDRGRRLRVQGRTPGDVRR